MSWFFFFFFGFFWGFFFFFCFFFFVFAFFFFFFFFFFDSRLADFWERNCPLAFCLKCFDCGAVALSASFFPFGFLDEK